MASVLQSLAIALLFGEVWALVEYAVFEALKPAALTPWLFYVGPASVAYGVRGGWQLVAHKMFAFGWLAPALTLVGVLVTAPLYPLYSKIGVKAYRVGISFAAAVIFYAGFIAALSLQLLLQKGAPRPYSIPLAAAFPAAVAALSAVFYLAFSGRRLARLWTWRFLPPLTLSVFVFAAALSFAPAPHRRLPAPAGPNVLLISIDALRADKVGPDAAGATLTPCIDDFAAGATTFKRCVTPAPWTLPAFASLFTGVYPDVHGAGLSAPLAPAFTTLAEMFDGCGYDTAAICANTICEPRFGLVQGYRYLRTSEMLEGTIATRLYYTRLPAAVQLVEWLVSDTTPTVERRALAYLGRRRPDDRPFFLWVHFLDPHAPYTPPPRYVSAEVNAARARFNPDDASPANRILAEAFYDGEVRFVDEAVGRILARLRGRGLEDNTVVIITSDHGEEFWEHGGAGHGQSLYDELITVPLVVNAPGLIPAGKFPRDQVSLLDVYATLVETCALAPPGPVAGHSLLSAAPAGGFADFAFSSTPSSEDYSRAAASGRGAKIIVSRDTGAKEFYILTSDPGERSAVTDETLMADHLAAFNRWRKRLAELARYYGAGGPADAGTQRNLRALGYLN